MLDRQTGRIPGKQASLFVADGKERRSHSPKRPQTETVGLADLFPYYAGFSFDWAREKLADISPTGSLVIDPWNGSGTTTLAAQANGFRSIGIDLNPIANVVAQLRTHVGKGASITDPPPSFLPASEEADPLCAWFSAETAGRFREWAIELGMAPQPRSSLGLVSLFRVVRRETRNFGSANPTWVKRASNTTEAVEIPVRDVDALLLEDQKFILDRLRQEPSTGIPAAIVRASAKSLPVRSGTVDAILTSPPYLTRIDYAVAYSRELAVFGIDIFKERSLRAELMGTTLIRPENSEGAQFRSPLASSLLTRVEAHPSKASSGYYLKQFKQYLRDLAMSLDEISRVAKNRAIMILVVQDSYYKEIPINLAGICTEEALQRGWELRSVEAFDVNRILTQRNAAAREYPKGKVVETVITLERIRNG